MATKERSLVGGNFNTREGKRILEMAARIGPAVLNPRSIATLPRPNGRGSIQDVTRRFIQTFEAGEAVQEGTPWGGAAAVDTNVNSVMNLLAAACEVFMARRAPSPMHWWTDEISELRKECDKLHHLARCLNDEKEACTTMIKYRSAKK